jgi:hypothetical protein
MKKAALIVSVVLTFMLFLSCEKKATGPTEGNIAVNSTPQGAQINLDGSNTGEITPDTLYDIAQGNHTLKLSLEGFANYIENVVVEGGLTKEVNAVFLSGFISVSSNPSGAKIYIDTVNIGAITPANLTNLPEGNHCLTLSLDGYFSCSETITVAIGETTIVNKDLSRCMYIYCLSYSDLYISKDGGYTWVNCFPYTDIQCLNSYNGIPNTVYVGEPGGWSDWDPPIYAHVQKTEDNGGTWTTLGIIPKTGTNAFAIAVDPNNRNNIYVAGQSYIYSDGSNLHFLGQAGGFFKSTNGGSNFSMSSSGLPSYPYYTSMNTAIYSLAINPTVTSIIYIGICDLNTGGGVYKSTNSGATWVEKSNGLPNDYADIYSLAIDPSHPNKVFATVEWSGIYKTTDGGDNWSLINDEESVVEFDPRNSQIIYSGTKKSTDGGNTWFSTGLSEYPGDYIKFIEIDTVADVIYAGVTESGNTGIYCSKDEGLTWVRIANWFAKGLLLIPAQ